MRQFALLVLLCSSNDQMQNIFRMPFCVCTASCQTKPVKSYLL